MSAIAAILSILALAIAPAQPTTEVEGFIAGADGVKLFYRKVGAAMPVAVVLHGGPGSNINAVWPDLDRLARTHTVVLYDQRGGGRSEVITDPKRLTARDHVRDLEAVRATLQLPKFTLIGESWGAGLAALYTHGYPEHVERLILIGPMPPTRAMLEQRLDESDAAVGFRKLLDDVRRAMPRSADPVATCRQFFTLYTRQFFVSAEGQQRRRGSSCDAPAEGVRNYFVVNDATFASLGAWDFRPQLASLKMPALVIEGAQSIPSTIESARVFAASLPNATLVLVPGAGHYPQVEQPELFFKAIESFTRMAVR